MLLNFIDREEELSMLEARYSRGSFELMVLYGRRRIGKTELIKNFIQGKPHIYVLGKTFCRDESAPAAVVQS